MAIVGVKTVVPAFTNSALPRLPDHPLLAEGSLALIEPGNQISPLVGVSSSGSALYNVAWKQAKRTIGSGDSTTLAASWETGSALTSSIGVIERSSKGGIHVIMSQGASPGTGRGCGIRPPLPIADYIANNPSHLFYASTWFRMTKFGENSSQVAGYALSSSPSQTTPNLMLSIGPAATYPSTANRLYYRRSRNSDWRPSQDSAVTPPYAESMFCNVLVNGYSGTPSLTGSAAQAQMAMFAAGQFGPFSGTHTVGATYGFSSRLLWLSYIEDLTVSGRSYAQVDALDYGLYTAALASGGAYYNDTYTTPVLA